LVPEKGVNVLLGAIPAVLEKKPNTKFVIAGEGWHRKELERIAQELGLNNKVLFTGYLPEEDFLAYLNVADILVVPSTYEPFGIVALEGMATKTPVVVSDVGGLSEIIDHHWTGYKVPPDNSHAIAEALIKLLDDEKLRQKIVKNAYEKLIHVFDWEIIADQTIEIYQKIFKEWRNHWWKTRKDHLKYQTVTKRKTTQQKEKQLNS